MLQFLLNIFEQIQRLYRRMLCIKNKDKRIVSDQELR